MRLGYVPQSPVKSQDANLAVGPPLLPNIRWGEGIKNEVSLYAGAEKLFQLLVTAILAWLHIFSAISWLGGGLMFALVVGPGLAKLSPPSSGEFLVKVVPRVVRFFQITAGTTILFGVLFLYSYTKGDISDFLSFSTHFGLYLTIGLSLGLIAFLISEFVAVPIQLKAVRMIKEMQAAGQHQPPPDLPKTLKLAANLATLTVVLLILTSIFMVASGFY
jgi:uncharacterized membrane protein